MKDKKKLPEISELSFEVALAELEEIVRQDRSVLEILAERGETRPTSGFGTAVYMSGNISAEGIDNGWRHMQEGANGLMISRAIANGMAPWTGLIMTFADSVDDLLSAAANAWADTAMQARNSMNDVKPLGRLINEIVA